MLPQIWHRQPIAKNVKTQAKRDLAKRLVKAVQESRKAASRARRRTKIAA
jgi:hypothetical protein